MMQSCLRNRWLRISVLASVVGLAWSLMLPSTHGQQVQGASAQNELLYVGMQEPGIEALRLDLRDGRLQRIGPVATGLRATWLLAHPARKVLYAVDDDNARPGSVSAFAVQPGSGALDKLGTVDTQGKGTTYLSLDADARTLLAASYGTGSTASIAVNADGSLGALVSNVSVTGSGPHRRQASAHNHGAVVAPGGRFVLVTDLGADRIFVHRFDSQTHQLFAQNDAAHAFAVPAGSGPRHLIFGNDGRFAYLLNELTAQLMVLRWDATQGWLAPEQTVSISSAGFSGVPSGAELLASADGRFLYAEDRGENTLVVYRIDAGTGQLTLVQRISAQGDKPWGMALDPSGRWLVAANQGSGTIRVFAVDTCSGELTATPSTVSLPRPVSLAFLR